MTSETFYDKFWKFFCYLHLCKGIHFRPFVRELFIVWQLSSPNCEGLYANNLYLTTFFTFFIKVCTWIIYILTSSFTIYKVCTRIIYILQLSSPFYKGLYVNHSFWQLSSTLQRFYVNYLIDNLLHLFCIKVCTGIFNLATFFTFFIKVRIWIMYIWQLLHLCTRFVCELFIFSQISSPL